MPRMPGCVDCPMGKAMSALGHLVHKCGIGKYAKTALACGSTSLVAIRATLPLPAAANTYSLAGAKGCTNCAAASTRPAPGATRPVCPVSTRLCWSHPLAMTALLKDLQRGERSCVDCPIVVRAV